MNELPKIKLDEQSVSLPRAKLTLIDGRGESSEAPAQSGNAVARAAKRFWAAARRLNKRAGEAEARLILRIFYYTVFGVLRLVRRKTADLEDGGALGWLPRESSGTDPTKQY